MSDEWRDRFLELATLAGEIPTDVLVKRARQMFPGLINDPDQRKLFREHLRFAAMCRRQVPLTPEDAAAVNMLAGASYVVMVDGETVGEKREPLPERTVEDILSESAVDLKA